MTHPNFCVPVPGLLSYRAYTRILGNLTSGPAAANGNVLKAYINCILMKLESICQIRYEVNPFCSTNLSLSLSIMMGYALPESNMRCRGKGLSCVSNIYAAYGDLKNLVIGTVSIGICQQ